MPKAFVYGKIKNKKIKNSEVMEYIKDVIRVVRPYDCCTTFKCLCVGGGGKRVGWGGVIEQGGFFIIKTLLRSVTELMKHCHSVIYTGSVLGYENVISTVQTLCILSYSRCNVLR